MQPKPNVVTTSCASWETVLGIFKIALCLRDRHVFIWQSVKVSNILNSLILKQIFWKEKTFFTKLEYHFWVETTKIKNTPFSFKTALSEANVKTNRMPTTKWIYHKEWSFASNDFFCKFCSSFRTSLKESIWCTNNPNVHFGIFCCSFI